MAGELVRVTGVDLTQIPGVDSSTALKIVSEIGLDMGQWKNEKSFCSWLGLSPNNKVSGGKRLSSRTRPTGNRVRIALRICANTLYRSQTALGAFLRRKKASLGSPKAITACAHKMAKQIYCLLKHGRSYIEQGADVYEKSYKDRLIKNLKRKARDLGLQVIPEWQETDLVAGAG